MCFVQYLFVGVATLSGVVYLVMFVVMVARAYRHLRDRQTNISHLSPQAQKTAQVGHTSKNQANKSSCPSKFNFSRCLV